MVQTGEGPKPITLSHRDEALISSVTCMGAPLQGLQQGSCGWYGMRKHLGEIILGYGPAPLNIKVIPDQTDSRSRVQGQMAQEVFNTTKVQRRGYNKQGLSRRGKHRMTQADDPLPHQRSMERVVDPYAMCL